MFKFNLNDKVEIIASGENGHVRGRAEYTNSTSSYFIHYKAADGRAVTLWFSEEDIQLQH